MLSLQMLPMSASQLLKNALVLWHDGNATMAKDCYCCQLVLLQLSLLYVLVNAKVSACAMMLLRARLLADLS